MKSIQNVAVIGLGTMGHGIAQAYAAAGLRVYAFDEVAAARTSLHARVRQNLQQFVRAGLATKRSVEPTLKRIVVCDTLEAAVREAQFVTETVREDLKTKQELLAKLEGMVGPQTILASNSSTFPISASGARLRRPGRAIVTHWFNPPHIVPTVEVVPGQLGPIGGEWLRGPGSDAGRAIPRGQLAAGLGIALLLNVDLPYMRAFRTALVIPMMITPIVSALCWKRLLDPSHGVVNYWLGQPDTAILAVWRSMSGTARPMCR